MSKKLLLADDSVVIQKLVGLSFANENIEIVSTDNGDDAVTMARELRPDVILADVVMPGLSGYEVCEAIKQDPELGRTPVLLLTGTFEAFDEARAAAVGANGQITKPFEAQALVERVNEVMNAPVEVAAPAAGLDTSKAQEALVSPLGEDLSASIPDVPDVPDVPDLPSASELSGPSSNDLFDSSITSLAGDVSLDVTPSLEVGLEDPNEETASGLFGAPGDGANDLLDTEGGSMVLGQSVAEAEAEAAAQSPIDAPDFGAALPPISESPLHAKTDATSGSDPLASLDADPLSPPPLPIATAVDLDSALDAGGLEGDATILVAENDTNATTSPNLNDPLSDPFSATSDFDDLTVHAPSADIDQDVATANSPNYDDSGQLGDAGVLDALDPLPSEATVVANLDEALAASPEQDIASASSGFSEGRYPTADPFTPSSIAAEATTANAADANISSRDQLESDAHIDGNSGTDPLGLAPTNTASDEVDFAFDVSEQVAANDLSETSNVGAASFEDSFSSLMDISESQILPASPEEPTPPVAATIDPVGAGFDVSSSDLATAPPTDLAQADDTIAEPRSAEPQIPEPEALVEVPELPQAYAPPQPAAVNEAAPEDSIMGSASLFDDLATGSPLDELDTPDAFSSAGDLDIDQDLLDDDLVGGLGGTSLESAEVFDAGFEPAEPVATTALPEEPEADAVLIHSAPDAPDDDFAIGGQAGPEARERSVPDLTPMMEQRIQETLEKVAWEAFSDLSESIVKQVMGRVEQIAWEVIPEMAETLVREEIRKMKGDEE